MPVESDRCGITWRRVKQNFGNGVAQQSPEKWTAWVCRCGSRGIHNGRASCRHEAKRPSGFGFHGTTSPRLCAVWERPLPPSYTSSVAMVPFLLLTVKRALFFRWHANKAFAWAIRVVVRRCVLHASLELCKALRVPRCESSSAALESAVDVCSDAHAHRSGESVVDHLSFLMIVPLNIGRSQVTCAVENQTACVTSSGSLTLHDTKRVRPVLGTGQDESGSRREALL